MNTSKPASPPLAAAHKKHVVHLISSLGNGGCENMLLTLLPALPQFRHTIVTIKSPGYLADRFSARGLSVAPARLRHFADIRGYFRLYRIIRSLKPQILTTYLPPADLIGRLLGRLAGVPAIVCSVRARLTQSPFWPLLLADGLTSSLVTHYHFNTPVTAKQYAKYFFLPPGKITIIPNCLSLAGYSPHPTNRLTRADLSLSFDQIVIGCVAQLRKQKGHRFLLTALAKLLLKHPELVVVLVGTGQQKHRLQKQINKLNIQRHVIMLGNRDDVPDILPLFDIFVLPTLYEGMSRALLEAMASRLAIITTDIPENRTIFAASHSALLVKPGSSVALAGALTQLIINPTLRSSLAKAAYTQVQSYHTPKIAQRFLNMYQHLI